MSEKKKRQKNKKRAVLRSVLIGVLVLVLLLFSGLYVAANTFGSIPLSNVADVFTSFSVRDGSTFPYTVDANSVVRMAALGSGAAVLRTDKLDILTKSGSILQTVQHTYTMPAMDVFGGRVLLYDRGSTRYMLLSKTKVLYSGEADGKILTASVAQDGWYAIAVGAEGDKSILTVYKSSGAKQFQYKCVSEYVTDIAFTRKGVAVTAAGVKGAEAYSRLLLLDLKKAEPAASLDYAGTSLFHVHSNTLSTVACSSSVLSIIGHDGERKPDVTFGSDTLQYFCADENGRATLVLLTYGNEHASRLLGLQKNGETAFEADCGEKLQAASRSASYTGVLTDNAVLTYNNSGSLVGTLTLTRSARDICLSGRNVLVLFNDCIDIFPASGEHTQKTE